jgi:hypothetical protein
LIDSDVEAVPRLVFTSAAAAFEHLGECIYCIVARAVQLSTDQTTCKFDISIYIFT